MVKPVPEGLAGEFAESLGVPGEGDAPVGQVEVIQREIPDRSRAGGVDRGQGDDQALCGADGHSFDGADLGVGHRQQAVPGIAGFQARGGVGEDQVLLLGADHDFDLDAQTGPGGIGMLHQQQALPAGAAQQVVPLRR